ncbi:MarR family transcriptional regulator [Pseudochelatococcus sp. B33]
MEAEGRVIWNDTDGHEHIYGFDDYMEIVADARYIVRKVQRIIDDCSRANGLEPLQHQALIQIYGAPDHMLPVGHLAERLNIVSALASRLVLQLETARLVRRIRSERDRRTTFVAATEQGRERLRAIVNDVHVKVACFRATVTPRQRYAALEISRFYVGSEPQA